ncbi:cysteine proteinase [Fistulina hepatica ATCC 64428]|uniref:ubiquitinyl hydrolase 1 n=1 Tax=Fistulina hepatica ATCC 64428 TaxID=1128425 RepID=A0A0D7AH59_9AGAR|nr:cysteine proteinase [Fistulina hepatica ATCC 64428]
MEDKSNASKSRRPLPTPGARPNTPTNAGSGLPSSRPSTPTMRTSNLTSTAIPPATFYGTKAPALPLLPRSTNPIVGKTDSLGSGHTVYAVDPTSPPPSYTSTSAYREPELVQDEPMDSEIPPLMPSPAYETGTWGNTSRGGWDTGENTIDWGASQSNDAWNVNPSAMSWEAPTPNYSVQKSLLPDIDNRDLEEEENWWDRDRCLTRPGPGFLPPVLVEDFHDVEHSLFSVSVDPPNTESSSSSSSSSSSTVGSPYASSSSASQGDTPPPTEEQTHTAVPHPNAYYCPRENGWVLLSWKSSSVAPPMAQSYTSQLHPYRLPDQSHRRRTTSCVGDQAQPFGRQANATHHFHKYARAIDAHKLSPPYRRPEWNIDEKRKRGRAAVVNEDTPQWRVESEQTETLEGDVQMEGKLLDLYMCCQCSLYVVASDFIPGVIPIDVWDKFIAEKRNNPPVGKNGETSVVNAVETIILALQNKLWRNKHKSLKVSGTAFQTKLGFSDSVRHIFEALGFTEEGREGAEHFLRPPVTDSSVTGKINTAKLLRAWVELSAWAIDFRRIHSKRFSADYREHRLTVKLDPGREHYQEKFGAHPDQIPRNTATEGQQVALATVTDELKLLGLTLSSFSGDVLAFAYLAQCRCDPLQTMQYFTAVSAIAQALSEVGECPDVVQELVMIEKSRNRFTGSDIVNAAVKLGFGADGPLRIELGADVEEDFIENAWKDCLKRAWRDPLNGSQLQREATEAFRILAEWKGSPRLRKAWESGKDHMMTPDKAYETLEVPQTILDDMLISVYTIRVADDRADVGKMRDALSVIADVRDSERLRQFLDTGADPGEIIVPVRPDFPRGLNQLGNTCYLNSLLQYFYTIKDLREAVLPMLVVDPKVGVEDRLTDDDLKRHRVGGRLVTRREITRSRQCRVHILTESAVVNQLANLFKMMEIADAAAVTPSVELAKLALVTSKDEEDEEMEKGGTDSSNSSNDTDATLVEDGPLAAQHLPSASPMVESTPTRSPSPTAGSVLGKRARRKSSGIRDAMDVDIPMSRSPKQSTTSRATAGSSSMIMDIDIEDELPPLEEATTRPPPPPLPPRKTTAPVGESVMMFGRQHDVSECMDNCMFQIETALLKFGGVADTQEEADKTSVVKRLFYGKIRQRIVATDLRLDSSSRPSVHEKEDLFSHLIVNVTDDGFDLYDGLNGYFDDDLEFEGKKSRMEVELVDLPPLLQIQMQRVQFNRDTLQPYKSQAYVKFGETIYIDRYMDSTNPAKKARSKELQRELKSCRERAAILNQGKARTCGLSWHSILLTNSPIHATLDATAEFLSQRDCSDIPGVTSDLIRQLEQEKSHVESELDTLRTRIAQLKEELEILWADDKDVAYELTSVFIHRGSSPSWGHYFFYSRNLPLQPDEWFKYNDSDVSVVGKEEVLKDTTGDTANPYLLVFARKGSEVVDTVKRDLTMFVDASS